MRGFTTKYILRRSTIDVHPNCFEAPHLRSSIPHPKTDFNKIYLCAVAQVYRNVIFRTMIDIATILG